MPIFVNRIVEIMCVSKIVRIPENPVRSARQIKSTPLTSYNFNESEFFKKLPAFSANLQLGGKSRHLDSESSKKVRVFHLTYD